MEAEINIFFLSMDPFEAAEDQVDKHVVKMIVETAQILSTAHRLLDGDDKGNLTDGRQELLYKITHKNHPSAVWARTSVENYNWLVDHLQGLLKEYTKRYDKIHKTSSLLYTLSSPPLNLKEWDWTEPPKCMPDECKKSDLVESYREYYRKEKSHMHSWKNKETPNWILHDA